jgi:putative phosphoesterase
MRIALLSDIHGNAMALKTTLNSALKSGCELFLVGGDSVGYYYDANTVLDLLFNLEFRIVRGNHEVMLQNLRRKPELSFEIKEKYGSALEKSILELTTEKLDFLCNAPDSLTIDFDTFSLNLSHGSPWCIDTYIYSDSDITVWQQFLNYYQDVFVIGNTHHQLIKKFEGKLIINPGSVGQSRTNKGMAQWAEMDSANLDVTFKSRAYDTSALIEECISFDPDLALLRKHL